MIVLVSSPLDDLCIDIWIFVIIIYLRTQMTKRFGTAMYYDSPCHNDSHIDSHSDSPYQGKMNVEIHPISKIKPAVKILEAVDLMMVWFSKK